MEENGAYSAPGSDEVTFGVWIAKYSSIHDTASCWLARGLDADSLTSKAYATAGGGPYQFRTGFYNDGVTDSIVVDAFCTSKSCEQAGHLFLQPQSDAVIGTGQRPISMMIRIDKLHSGASKQANYALLASEAEQFVSGLDLLSLSKELQ